MNDPAPRVARLDVLGGRVQQLADLAPVAVRLGGARPAGARGRGAWRSARRAAAPSLDDDVGQLVAVGLRQRRGAQRLAGGDDRGQRRAQVVRDGRAAARSSARPSGAAPRSPRPRRRAGRAPARRASSVPSAGRDAQAQPLLHRRSGAVAGTSSVPTAPRGPASSIATSPSARPPRRPSTIRAPSTPSGVGDPAGRRGEPPVQRALAEQVLGGGRGQRRLLAAQLRRAASASARDRRGRSPRPRSRGRR